MIIENILPEDICNLSDLQPEGWDDIKPHFEFYVRSAFCDPIKLIFDGKLAGVGTSICHKNTAWLAHIIVNKNYRNKGFGYSITKALVDRLTAKGFRTVYLDATELGYPVYLKAGFTVQTEYHHFMGVCSGIDIPVSPAIITYKKKYLDEVLKLDRKVSGEYRVQILKEHLNKAKIFLYKDKVRGVYFPTLKDGLIIASGKKAGIELLKLLSKTRDYAAMPAENITAREFLKENNYSLARTSKRMIFGKPRKWEPANLYSRISGGLG